MFIWAPCAQLYTLAETPSPPHMGSYTRELFWSAKIDDISLETHEVGFTSAQFVMSMVADPAHFGPGPDSALET
jgi:hypothetical protein